MASEKHRGAPKKQGKKPKAPSTKAAKRAAAVRQARQTGSASPAAE